MGTRAAFWVGNPIDLDSREWLGCIAGDGYPSNFTGLTECADEGAFRAAVATVASVRRDFAHPTGGWPFPWADDIFLTDCTYAFFNGAVQFCYFHKPFMPLAQWLETDKEERPEGDDPTHRSVPATAAYDNTQPDSIMIFRL